MPTRPIGFSGWINEDGSTACSLPRAARSASRAWTDIVLGSREPATPRRRHTYAPRGARSSDASGLAPDGCEPGLLVARPAGRPEVVAERDEPGGGHVAAPGL